MNKSDLVKGVAEKAGLSSRQAAAAVEAVFNTVRDALAKGEEVSIMGFGSFAVRSREARQGVNPRTGERIQIPASKSPVFSPGKGLRDAVKG